MKRFPALDFLRGLAILLVLFTHFKVVAILYQVGWIGVDLFFVLSGFLVSGLLFHEYQKYQRIHPLRFLIRRGFKIYPMFYFFIAVSVLLGPSLRQVASDIHPEYFSDVNRLTVLHEALFIQNYFPGIWINTWSLGVEEHFYFALVLVCFLVIKTGWIENRKGMVTGMVVLMLAALGMRIQNNISHPDFYYISHLFPTHLRMDSLLAGVLVSYFFHFENEGFTALFQQKKAIIFVTCLVLVSFSFFFPIKSVFMNTAGLTLIYLGFAGWVGLVVAVPGSERNIQKFTGKRMFRLISRLGIYSYSVYIWHLFVKHFSLYLFEEFIPDLPQPVYFMIYFILTMFTGVLLSKLIEKPMLNLRNKWVPGRK